MDALLAGSRDAVVFLRQAGPSEGALSAADPGALAPATTGRTLTFLRVTPAGEAVPEDAPEVGLAAIELLPDEGGGGDTRAAAAATAPPSARTPPPSLLPAAQALVGDLMATGDGGAATSAPAGIANSHHHLDVIYAPDASTDALIDGALKVR